ncbi:MAG: hypothetical protein RLZZ127_1522 [Planctomycetota bacterium]|jgi:nitrate/nitrite transporter NarK
MSNRRALTLTLLTLILAWLIWCALAAAAHHLDRIATALERSTAPVEGKRP